jgi:hypothetical protein
MVDIKMVKDIVCRFLSLGEGEGGRGQMNNEQNVEVSDTTDDAMKN